ncbi:MAG: alpha/beta hydrolase [Novosphingobium sp.]|nr:alpha/beta hydrolase [Novosphingobium sp.]
MRSASLLVLLSAVVAAPAAAQTIAVQMVVEEEFLAPEGGGERVVEADPVPVPRGIAAYGPFRVLDRGHVALVDTTDARSPGAFASMLHDYPAIATLELIECPGTDDDRANLQLGRMIHAHGLSTHVPSGGSVRSGAVELFIAGVHHRAELGAEFAVHAWADENGREPADYRPDAPENRAYLDYYREMGMSAAQAQAFYAMTNSVPNAQAKWLGPAELGKWVALN